MQRRRGRGINGERGRGWEREEKRMGERGEERNRKGSVCTLLITNQSLALQNKHYVLLVY